MINLTEIQKCYDSLHYFIKKYTENTQKKIIAPTIVSIKIAHMPRLAKLSIASAGSGNCTYPGAIVDRIAITKKLFTFVLFLLCIFSTGPIVFFHLY